ncbi:MATE efflux family protein [Peptoniphilus sp. ING2-D1G]|nr:MATE efflux family protein [Peptoniphilus sp. ING2-D1G]
MSKGIDILKDDVMKVMVKLSLPLMGTAFIQMAYSMVDLIWLGKVSTEAVAAVGSVGFFVWISQALTLIAKTGLSVGMSQAYGKNDKKSLISIMRSGFQVNFIIFVILTSVCIFFKKELLGIYNLEQNVEVLAMQYFEIVILGFVFTFLSAFFSAVYYAEGNSRMPFKISTISLVTNIVLDPVLIFGVSIFPEMGVRGAAIATVFAQGLQIFIYLFLGKKYDEIFTKVNFFEKFDLKFFIDILKLGVPTSITSIVHAFVGIKLNSYIAAFGSASVAAYTIGSQIESISWMSAEGFATALSTIFGQNYGAGNFKRLKEARKKGLKILTYIGVFAAGLLFIFGKNIFEIFIPVDAHVIMIGANYLKINAISELFMCYEIGTTGMLNGLGLTKYPAINSVILNVMRIPIALMLMPILNVDGIWFAMSISSCIKGITILLIYVYLRDKTSGFRVDMEKYVSRVKDVV